MARLNTLADITDIIRLWDKLFQRVLPQLTGASLGSLRGTCSPLQDLRDADISSSAWAAAALGLLPQALADMQEHQPELPSSEGMSIHVQDKLRQFADTVQTIKTGGHVTHLSDGGLLNMDTSLTTWSLGGCGTRIHARTPAHHHSL